MSETHLKLFISSINKFNTSKTEANYEDLKNSSLSSIQLSKLIRPIIHCVPDPVDNEPVVQDSSIIVIIMVMIFQNHRANTTLSALL